MSMYKIEAVFDGSTGHSPPIDAVGAREALEQFGRQYPGVRVQRLWMDVTRSATQPTNAPTYRVPATPHEAASVWFHEGDGDVRLDVQPPADGSRRDLMVMRALLQEALSNVAAALNDRAAADGHRATPPFPVVAPQY